MADKRFGEARPVTRRFGLRAHLVGLILAVLLPALAFGAAASWFALRSYGAAQETRLADTARALASTISGEISARIAALRVLASSPDLEDGGTPAAFARMARATAEVFGSWVVLFDRDAGQLLNTRLPAGAPLPGPGGGIGPGGGGRWVAEAIRTGQPQVTDLATGRVSGRPTAFVFVPVPREGGATRVLGVALLPEHLSALLAGQATSGAGTISLTDGLGILVARSRDAGRLVGQPRPKRTDREPESLSGMLSGRDLERGAPIRIAYQVVPGTPGWTLWVNEPEATLAAARRGPMLSLLLGAAVALLLGLVLTAALARRVLRPVAALVRRADAMARAGTAAADLPAIGSAPVAEFEALRQAGERAENALRRSEERLRNAQEAGGVGTWEWDLGTGELHWSDTCHRIHGSDPAEAATAEAWRGGIHPEDLPRVEERLRSLLASAEAAWEAEFRFRRISDRVERRMLGRGEVIRDAAGRPLRMLGVAFDVTEKREAEERQRLLAREVDHRAKNVLAVVQAAVRLTPKDDPEAYAKAIEGRVHALGRAQTLLAEDRWRGADLRALLRGELRPFLGEDGASGPKAELTGPPVLLPAGAAQPLAMAVHELATNALKHGALSVPEGHLEVSWRRDPASDLLSIRWVEHGGPPVATPPLRRGFGTRVLDGTLRMQLGGRISLDWRPQGLVCDLELPLSREGVRPPISEAVASTATR